MTYERQGKEMVTFRVYFMHLDDVNAFWAFALFETKPNMYISCDLTFKSRKKA